MTAEQADGHEGSVHLEVFARESVPPSVTCRQQAFVERLRDRAEADTAVDLTVDTWSKQVSAPRDQRLSSAVRDRYTAFERVAAERGYRLEPAFRKRERTSVACDDTSTVVDLPVLCVALYEDGDLRDVFPRSVDGDVHPVDDVFTALDGSRTDSPSAELTADTAPSTESG